MLGKPFFLVNQNMTYIPFCKGMCHSESSLFLFKLLQIVINVLIKFLVNYGKRKFIYIKNYLINHYYFSHHPFGC